MTLTVSASTRDGRLLISVGDTGAGGGAPGEGVGLRNVAGRLKAHYGEAAAIRTIRQTPGFVVELELPLSFAADG